MNNMIKILIASIILALVSGAAASAETLRGAVTELRPVYAEHVSKTPCQKGYTEQVFIPANGSYSATPEITDWPRAHITFRLGEK